MIRASIAGGESECAGELIRILLYHPDVEIIGVHAPALAGKALDDIHHGMIGDTDLRFNSTIDFSKSNVLFICAPQPDAFYAELPVDMRIIDLTNTHLNEIYLGNFDDDNAVVETPTEYIYGICELNRKPLVRGALRAAVPTPVAQASLLALLPLATNLLLNSDITISATAPVSAGAITEIQTVLRTLQLSFNHKIEVENSEKTSINTTLQSGARRALFVQVTFNCGLELAQVTDMFNEFYDDHNFTFITSRTPRIDDVANTNKCIINIAKDSDKYTVTTAIDPLIKGAAGTAVHAMNLLFGLHERVGLTLKPSLGA